MTLLLVGCEAKEMVEGSQTSDSQTENVQYRIDENEIYLVNSKQYDGERNTKVYAQSIVSCDGKCKSKYMDYEVALHLVNRATEIGG